MDARRIRRVAVAAAAGLGLLLLVGYAGPWSGESEPAEGRSELPPWAWQMPQCVAYRPAELAAPQHRRWAQVTDQSGFTEQVEEYDAGWGWRAVAEIRAVLGACSRYEYGRPGDPTGYLAQNRVVETGFAGDESLLVETVHLTPPDTEVWYTAVVRHGDRLTTVRTADRGAAQTRCLVMAGPATCA